MRQYKWTVIKQTSSLEDKMAKSQENLFNNIAFGSTHQLITYVRHLLNSNVTLSMHPDVEIAKPSLLCANHFTRVETFILPSILYGKLDYKVRSLGDKGLFESKLSDFLESLGTLATNNPNRDTIMISDLMTGNSDWIIYPEGSMMKNKKITAKSDKFIVHEPDSEHAIYTGAAVVALKSELEKRAYNRAKHECQADVVNNFREKYNIANDESLSYASTQLIPTTITYFPIRPGNNFLLGMADSIFTVINEDLLEELEIEGNILANADMHIHLGEPLDVGKYIHSAIKILRISHEDEHSDAAIIEHCRQALTTDLMDAVYKNTVITFDHVFALILENYTLKSLRLTELRALIFICVKKIISLQVYRVHEMLQRDFYKLLIDEPFEMFDSVLSLALEQNVIEKNEDGSYKINHKVLANEHTFHTVRLHNTLRVILNEVALLKNLTDLVKTAIDKPAKKVQKKVFDIIFKQDLKRFDHAYTRFYSIVNSKPKEIGKPFVLYNSHFDRGMVISHGYKAAPKEIEDLAYFIHEQGINVYAIRIEGHGTLPQDLKETSYTHWIDSFNRGFAAMRQVSKRLYLCGFSAGGLLALVAAASKQHKIDALICINSAIEINDMRFNYFLPTIGVLSSWLSIINSDLEYIHSDPENPDINYDKHYVNSIMELKKLIDYTRSLLDKVTTNTLIIQGDNDPVVHVDSANIIFEGISSEVKRVEIIPANEHVIVTSERKTQVFEAVKVFLDECKGSETPKSPSLFDTLKDFFRLSS